jgi:hypothetical protein
MIKALHMGVLSTLQETVESKDLLYEIRKHTDSAFAGSLGAAILGGFRYERLEEAS